MDNPLAQLQQWLDDAVAAGIAEPNAMSLATSTPDGTPAVRTVLLKGVSDGGLVFFTNYHSAKGRQLEANPRAAASLTWPTLGRQVRAVGTASKITAAESDEYFAIRPRGSQIAAWASPQSEVLPDLDRTTLEGLAAEAAARFEGQPHIPRPPHWGGYRLVPAEIEFWTRGEDRLHDRLRYQRPTDGDGAPWTVDRLAP
jgi:pyridoxamine 5'-phosphate oxidase